MAKQELFEKPFGRWFVTHMGGFPVVRGSGGATAIKKRRIFCATERSWEFFSRGHTLKGWQTAESQKAELR